MRGRLEEGLNSKVKLLLYKTFNKVVYRVQKGLAWEVLLGLD